MVCVSGAVRGQSDAPPEDHQSLEKPPPAPTLHPAGLHEDSGEGWTSAHVQTEGRLDGPVQVPQTRHLQNRAHLFIHDLFVYFKVYLI